MYTILRVTGFRWDDWNRINATKHGCKISEIESVVRAESRRGAAVDCGNDKFRVQGRGQGGRIIEVIFLFDEEDASVMYDQTLYVIHAMPLTTRRRRSGF